ncbi:MAG: glycoside hydrolase family 127 protein, partial [Tannerella sp.]|nr:glycoside hydrolase family 127 protein [Tannerella sp.]
LSLHQHTAFPSTPDVKLHLELDGTAASKIRIRVPSWAASAMSISVNGKRVASGKPGAYVTLNRTWKSGDEISFTLPMGFRLTKYAGVTEDFCGKETYALEYGPILMGLSGEAVRDGIVNLPFTAGELTARLKPVAGKPSHFSIEGDSRQLEYVPYYGIMNNQSFTCYPFFAEKK